MMNELCKLLIFTVFFVSCKDMVVLDPRERAVVVDCILVEDSIQTVNLRYTSYVSEDYYPFVEEAEVFIEAIEDDIYPIAKFNFRKIKDGIWQSPFIPEGGCTYKLTIKIPGLKEITAFTDFPKGNFIVKPVYDTGSSIVLHTKDEPPVGPDVYGYITGSILFKYNMEGDAYNRIEIDDSSAFWIYGVDFEPATQQFFVAEFIYSEHFGVDKFNLSNVIGNQLNEFNGRINDIDFPDILEYGIPMYFPSISLYDNLSDKHFFYRYLRVPVGSFTDYSLKFITNSKYNQEPAGTFQYLPSFKQNDNGVAHPYAHLVFEQTSKEYDKYLKSVFNFQFGIQNKVGDDIINLYDYKEVYTNINNAVGIFGCSKKRLVLWANAEHISYKGQSFPNKNFIPYKEYDAVIKNYYMMYGK